MKQYLFLLCLILGRAATTMEVEVNMDDQEEDSETTGNEETKEDEPGDDYMQEIMEQVEAQRNDTNDNPEKRQAYYANGVSHGSTIGLQCLYSKLYWLGCRGTYYRRASCPKLYMEGNDWSTCYGEVHRIYRARGRGYVRVGDVVGIYIPYYRKWFSMRGGYGHKSVCPGGYTYTYGFANRHKWYSCYGEVYKIYAKGKRVGDVIYRYDDIMLYYVNGNKYVSLVHDQRVDLRTCPGSYRPPPPNKYDICYGQVFQLWKR